MGERGDQGGPGPSGKETNLKFKYSVNFNLLMKVCFLFVEVRKYKKLQPI